MVTATAIKEEKQGTNNTTGIFIDSIKILPTKKAVISYRKNKDEFSESITYEGKEEITEEFNRIF